ncbi:MAG: guanylate kinase [Flavobacteriales bacterium]
MSSEHNKLLIFSAPSGAGKSTITRHLTSVFPELEFSISACSRSPRVGEIDTKDYYFLGVEGFKKRIKEEAFVEWEEVYPNHFYGTLKSELQRIWDAGKIAIFDVDVLGGMALKTQFGNQALSVFVNVSSIDILEKRLRYRNTESEEKLQMRLAKAEREMEFAKQFDCVIENNHLEEALEQSEAIIKAFIEH